MSIRYPDPDHPGAEIILANCVAWRQYPDGRGEDLSEKEQDVWYQRLHEETEAQIARYEAAHPKL